MQPPKETRIPSTNPNTSQTQKGKNLVTPLKEHPSTIDATPVQRQQVNPTGEVLRLMLNQAKQLFIMLIP